MSHWNNSYTYNNQYPTSNSTWNGDPNSLYMDQTYYGNGSFDPSNQYVSFNEFITQIQTNEPSSSTNFNNPQYQNYVVNPPSVQEMPSTNQSSNIPNGMGSNISEAQSSYPKELVFKSNLTPTATEFVPKKSNVANKKQSSINRNIPTDLSKPFVPRDSKNTHKNSIETNWRERPQHSNHLNGNAHQNTEENQLEKDRQYDPSLNSKSNQDLSNLNQEKGSHHQNLSSSNQENRSHPQDSGSSNQEIRSHHQDSGSSNQENRNHHQDLGSSNYDIISRHQNLGSSNQEIRSHRQESANANQENRRSQKDSGSKNQEYRNRQLDSGSSYLENRSRHQESGSGYQETRSRHQDSGNAFQENRSHHQDSGTGYQENRSRYPDSGSGYQENRSRQQDSGNVYQENRSRLPDSGYSYQENRSRHQDSGSSYQENRNRYQEPRYYESNYRNERNQNKFNNKSKNNKDSERTFYNSTSNRVQDSKNAKGEGSSRNRNWVGSQRLRSERNVVEDEQYANDYLQLREEKAERFSREVKSSPSKSRIKTHEAEIELTQRDRLSEQLDKGTLECLVCCERVKQIDSVWSCGNCFHVLHLRCIRKWAMSSLVDGKWRCPACQNTSDTIPTDYRCMCGSVRSPDYQRGSSGAHTCGKSCKRVRPCPHPCTLLCHPGPCPPCQATVKKQCGCGAETRSILCSSKLPQVCGRVCNKTLDCGVHTCSKDCHEGECEECQETVEQVCYCPAGKVRSVPCTAETGTKKSWSCGSDCSRILSCGAHVCRASCHPPPCEPCELLPEAVITCPCNRTKLAKGSRAKCIDPIPLCENICAKPLPCGPDGDKHFCKLNCHHGECPVCPEKTLMQCRCGHSSREIPCAELLELGNNVLCQKKCNKKLSCGRHRCREVCCAAPQHRCSVICGRMLQCQLHRCEQFCHTGHCAPCAHVSFDELRCECGLEVILPPVRCGTRPPVCSAPCRRRRSCGHEPLHACHAGPCPPCVVLTARRCHGGHEERKTIPCSQEEFSCGLPCGKPLPCGKHTCIKVCHKGPCDTEKCSQPCREKRPSCGHECAAPCHAGVAAGCPSAAPCRRPVRAVCPCRRRAADRPCAENALVYARIISTLAATKIQDGGSMDISEVHRPEAMLRTLECDDECRVEARTRQLALALQIRNPDISSKLAPRYSDFVKQMATKDPSFARQIHDKMTELVQLAKKSKQKTRAHSFPSMNWQKRQFIHELCEHFGCESVAYDAEPNRNVVATADREKSWLPAMSILEVLAREAGKRKVPGPILRSPANAAAGGTTASVAASAGPSKPASSWATLTSTNAWAARSQPKPVENKPPEPKIDYFDNPPEN